MTHSSLSDHTLVIADGQRLLLRLLLLFSFTESCVRQQGGVMEELNVTAVTAGCLNLTSIQILCRSNVHQQDWPLFSTVIVSTMRLVRCGFVLNFTHQNPLFCFILKFVSLLSAMALSGFLPDSICSAQLDMAFIKNILSVYSLQRARPFQVGIHGFTTKPIPAHLLWKTWMPCRDFGGSADLLIGLFAPCIHFIFNTYKKRWGVFLWYISVFL